MAHILSKWTTYTTSLSPVEGMGWILKQPADDDESTKTATILKETGKCLFDLTKYGARLIPVAFGSRGCNANEVNFHSFTVKGACGC